LSDVTEIYKQRAFIPSRKWRSFATRGGLRLALTLTDKIACSRTIVGRDDADDGGDHHMAVLERPDEFSVLPSGIDAIEGSSASFVCFRASWPVNCCTCSRQQVAHRDRGAAAQRAGP